MDRKKKRIRKNISEVNRKSYENNGINSESNDLFRHSFSYRICDDLCEVLLKYLSFEDKIKFECVSKRFQRLIFNKQYSIDINLNSLRILLEYEEINNRTEGKVKIIAFEKLLKKCKFINAVNIRSDYVISNSEDVLQLIANNCKHLKSIEYDFGSVGDQVLTEFGLKCGQKLEEINCLYNCYDSGYVQNANYKLLLNLCPNLLRVNNLRLNDLVDKNKCLVPKLIQIKNLGIDKHINLMEVLTESCGNSLKTLTINHNDRSENSLNILVKQISGFVNLEKLMWDLSQNWFLPKTFAEDLRNIGNKCTELYDLRIQARYESMIPDLLNSIQFFERLKILYLDIEGYDSRPRNIRVSKSIPGMSCRRSKIDYELSDKQISDIINNCPEIKSIHISKANISHKTIDALIGLALKKPHIQFNHEFGFIIMEKYERKLYKKKRDLPNNLTITIAQDSNEWKKFYF